MKICKKPGFSLATSSDVALLLGLSPRAKTSDIASAFGRATGCEAELELLEERIYRSGPETWEVRIINDLPKCRVELRRGGRGPWASRACAVPEDVLEALRAHEDRSGRLVTDRSWKAWQRADWFRFSGRRLKSRTREIIATIEIGDVRRPTGEVKVSLVIRALGAPYPELLEPVLLNLPVQASVVMGAVDHIKASSEAQIDMVA